MSLTFLAEVSCDAAGCQRTRRAWSWASLGALAAVRAECTRDNWLTVKLPGEHVQHYCPDHKDEPVKAWDASSNRARRADAWAKAIK